jgi:alpha-beta hydrolase superfamily lysophospholipase
MSSVAPHQLFITVVHGTWPEWGFADAPELAAEHNEHPQATQLVVAHSHGGNIVLRALYHLQKREGVLASGEESANPLVVELSPNFGDGLAGQAAAVMG